MGLLRIFLGFLGCGIATSVDVVGSTGCTAPSCVLSNPSLRFGTGAENSVNAYGLFQQPWYYSSIGNAWYKLTFAGYPLDTAIGMGTGSAQWSGATVVDLYTQTPMSPATDYSEFVVDSSDDLKSVGHGKIVSTRVFMILGNLVTLENIFSLGLNDSFVKIVSKFTNNASATINNVIIWTGTRDDFVGTTDVNIKTRGNLDTGSFVAITANDQQSRAIMITNPTEGVLFYSETAGVMTAYDRCCSFANVYNMNPLTIPPATANPTDGSYAAVLPIGNVDAGSSASITWYYAAGAINSLSTVAGNVAAAQQAEASAPSTPSWTPTTSSSPTGTPTTSLSPTGTPSFTRTGTDTSSFTRTVTPSRTPTRSPTQTASYTASETDTQTPSWTPTVSATPTPSWTASETDSQTPSWTPTVSATPTPSWTASETDTQTPSWSPTSTGSPSQTGTKTVAALVVTQPVYLQLGSNVLPNLIAVNVASTAAILSMVGFCVFSAYCVFLYRRLGQKECIYCDAVLKKDEKMVEHLNTCEEYKYSHVKRSEVYKSMKKAWA
jgi:hypothetical protein